MLNHRLRIIELFRLENIINTVMSNYFSRALSLLLILLFSCTLCCWTVVEEFQKRKWCYATLHLPEFYFEVIIWSFLCCCLAEIIIYRIFSLFCGQPNGCHIINMQFHSVLLPKECLLISPLNQNCSFLVRMLLNQSWQLICIQKNIQQEKNRF